MSKHRILNSILSSLIILIVSVLFFSCQGHRPDSPFSAVENPWPSIRRERIQTLLPKAMALAGVDAWIVICRENNNDPLAVHVGGENASSQAAFLFFLKNSKIHSIALSGAGEATALKDIGLHDEVIVLGRGKGLWSQLSEQIYLADPQKIAINSSSYVLADGLSYIQRKSLEKALDTKYTKRLVSSASLVREWLSVKLPAEVEIMRKAAVITAQWQIDAYKTIIPGKTTDADVARYLKTRMKAIAVTDAWSPDQNPSVNSGPDRGHSHSTEKIIQHGDVIQTDFGIKVYGMWCSDIQRFAYVLKPGETEAPAEMKIYLRNAVQGHRKVLSVLRPGITGWWQVMGRNETTWETRKRLEVYYVSNWSLWMDAFITLKTIWVMISGQGR